MNKIINFKDFKDKARKELEDKAYDQYGILKLDDNLYLAPDASFTTGSLDLKVFLESKLSTIVPFPPPLGPETITNKLFNIHIISLLLFFSY